jgi:hypothetical protein
VSFTGRCSVTLPKPAVKRGVIPTAIPLPREDGAVRFSFKYACLEKTEKFCILKRDADYFRCLLGRLKSVSAMRVGDFRSSGGKALRAHKITFDESTTEDGFGDLNPTLMEQVREHAYQFSLSANEHGRIHGFLLDDVFFVVWIDPDHQLYR